MARHRTKDEDRVYQLARYHRRRTAAIESLGGRCTVCGSTDRLELDHIDPSTKSFEIGSIWGIGEAKFQAEVAKCQVLCKDHHTQKTRSEQLKDQHGTWGQVRKRKCKCDICREFVRAYERDWRQRRKAALGGVEASQGAERGLALPLRDGLMLNTRPTD